VIVAVQNLFFKSNIVIINYSVNLHKYQYLVNDIQYTGIFLYCDNGF